MDLRVELPDYVVRAKSLALQTPEWTSLVSLLLNEVRLALKAHHVQQFIELSESEQNIVVIDALHKLELTSEFNKLDSVRVSFSP
jgi:hypothetical protein